MGQVQEHTKGHDRVSRHHGQTAQDSTRSEQSAVLVARHKLRGRANRIWSRLKSVEINIPKGIMHAILWESSEAVEHKSENDIN